MRLPFSVIFSFMVAHCCLSSYKLVRGALDFAGVVGRATSRSKYGYVLQVSCKTVADNFVIVSRSPRSKSSLVYIRYPRYPPLISLLSGPIEIRPMHTDSLIMQPQTKPSMYPRAQRVSD